MNIFALSLVLVAVLADDYDAPRGKSTQRGCVIPNAPQNLHARTQSRGRILRFRCDPGFVLIGKRYATCLGGRWNSPPPICIGKGCPLQTPPQNGRMTESYDGAMLMFGCNPGYVRNGSSAIYCALPQWNGTAPTCTVPTINPSVTCDFEDPDLCGWSHDVTHDFEWKRNKFTTPSGHVGTGPSFDHTLGKGLNGNYMYLEASAPQKQGDTTRLFSPVYPTVLSGSCFTFWYHMYGSTIGSLSVYLKEEKQVLAELTPVWSKDFQTGNNWLQGQIDVPQLPTNFQLVIEGVRGADYMGDIAFDDVRLSPGSCQVQGNNSEPIQGNGTTGTTTDQGGGGPGEAASQDSTLPTTTATTTSTANIREVTSTILPLTTVATEPRTVGTTSPLTSSSLSTMASTTSSITTEIITSTPSTSKKAELTSGKAETTTAATQPQQTDYVNNTSSSTQGTYQRYSTSPRIDASETTKDFRSTESPTVDYRYTTEPSSAVTTTPSSIRTTTSIDLSSTPLQTTTTMLPTTRKGFVFPKSTRQTQMTTTSLPTVSTTMRSTTYPESNLTTTTKRFPFIIKNPNTTTITTTTTTTTTTSKIVYTSSRPQSTVSTTDATTTSILVPDSSNLTATTATPVTTTKTTASPRTTSTRKPFIYIVPKTTRTVTVKPLGSTTQTRQTMSTYPVSPKTTEATTQYSTSSGHGSTKRKIPFFPPKQITTPTSTTDIRSLFPESSEEISNGGEKNNSGPSEDSTVSPASEPVSEPKPEASARWDEFPRRPHPRDKQTPGAGVSALATACSLGAVFLVVGVFTIVYLVRRRKLKQHRYGSTSEMRYITQSEELQLGSADNSDMIKLL